MIAANDTLSLGAIYKRYAWRIRFTWVLVLLEAILFILFPMAIGWAIDDLLESRWHGLWALGLLGFATLGVGAGRRYYDTRIYAGIYERITPELVQNERARDKSVSVITARTGLLKEFVEFLENSFPEMMNSLIALVGTLVIILFLNIKVFLACLLTTALIAVVYTLSSNRTYRSNQGFNHTLEEQVDVLEENEATAIKAYYKKLSLWNIRLSDLETVTFSICWVFLIALLVYAVVAVVQSGLSSHGAILAILMYVFSYIEAVVAIPYFYQQWVRLQEITHRLSDSNGETSPPASV